MRIVVLVPRRAGDLHRDRSWAWLQDHWAREHPGWPVVEGDHPDDGTPFNRSAAINRAAEAAGDWDVAVIADSDSFVDPDRLREAVHLAATTGRMAIAFEHRAHVRREMSDAILEGYPGPWEPGVADYLSDGHHHSGMNALPRALWDAAGGFDVGFDAPGAEDTAFDLVVSDIAGFDPAIASPANCGLPGRHHHVPGVLWHLWHPIRPESTPANNARLERYWEIHFAGGDLDDYRALRSEVTV